jgi:hypothetical protein
LLLPAALPSLAEARHGCKVFIRDREKCQKALPNGIAGHTISGMAEQLSGLCEHFNRRRRCSEGPGFCTWTARGTFHGKRYCTVHLRQILERHFPVARFATPEEVAYGGALDWRTNPPPVRARGIAG